MYMVPPILLHIRIIRSHFDLSDGVINRYAEWSLVSISGGRISFIDRRLSVSCVF